MNALLAGLLESELVKVMVCTTAKEIRDKMSNCYEGDNKAEQAKVQGFRMQFDSFKMHEDDDISKYFLRVDEVVNIIRGIDEDLKEPTVVQKVLRYFPKIFNPKVSTIEDMKYLKNLTLDQLLGTLTTYEMRISNNENDSREKFIKIKKGIKKAKKKSSHIQESNSYDSEGRKSTDEDRAHERSNEFMLVAIENLEIEGFEYHGEDVKVDLEGELANFLEQIQRLRNKNKTKKELSAKDKYEAIEPLLLQIEEGKNIQETINQQLSEKNQACNKLKG
eukprot:PITA_04369